MSRTSVETAHVPGYIGETAPWYGCNRNPECIGYCWYHNRIVPRFAANPNITCAKCKTGEPHVHLELMKPTMAGRMEPRCYSGHMGEIADLPPLAIELIQKVTRHPNSRNHIFQPFTHRPMEFYAKYPDWSENVWACGTFTQGRIKMPRRLNAGKIVAYCEPVMGELLLDVPGVETVETDNRYSDHCLRCGYELEIDITHECPPGFGRFPDWLVIGLLNPDNYARYGITLEQVAGWIKSLMAQADDLGIPVYCKKKDDSRWEKMGIEPIQRWPICG